MSHGTKQNRKDRLEQMLLERQAQLQNDVSARIRTARSDAGDRISEEIDCSDAVIQGDMDFALIQMKGEALNRVRQALVRLEAGAYGSCLDCQAEIPQDRLRALPFAVRCTRCEDSREQLQSRTRHAGSPSGPMFDRIAT